MECQGHRDTGTPGYSHTPPDCYVTTLSTRTFRHSTKTQIMTNTGIINQTLILYKLDIQEIANRRLRRHSRS